MNTFYSSSCSSSRSKISSNAWLTHAPDNHLNYDHPLLCCQVKLSHLQQMTLVLACILLKNTLTHKIAYSQMLIFPKRQPKSKNQPRALTKPVTYSCELT